MRKDDGNKFPRFFAGGDVVYLIGLTGDRVKVGITGNVRRRMATHGRFYGDQIEWIHVFPPRKVSSRHERLAISALSKRCTRHNKTELFSGIGKADAIACVRKALADHEKWLEDLRLRERVERECEEILERMLSDARAGTQSVVNKESA